MTYIFCWRTQATAPLRGISIWASSVQVLVLGSYRCTLSIPSPSSNTAPPTINQKWYITIKAMGERKRIPIKEQGKGHRCHVTSWGHFDGQNMNNTFSLTCCQNERMGCHRHLLFWIWDTTRWIHEIIGRRALFLYGISGLPFTHIPLAMTSKTSVFKRQ